MNLLDPSWIRQIPVESVGSDKVVIGGMWGGKFLCYDIQSKGYESLMKHSGTVTAFASSEER